MRPKSSGAARESRKASRWRRCSRALHVGHRLQCLGQRGQARYLTERAGQHDLLALAHEVVDQGRWHAEHGSFGRMA